MLNGDDLLLLIEGNSRVDLESKSLSVVSDWSLNVGVEVSKDKTVCMLMSGRLNTASRPLCIRVNGSTVKYVNNTKYLGISIGERINFKIHLNRLREKMVTVVSGITRVLRSEWGLGRKAMLVICKSLGSMFWLNVGYMISLRT